MAYSLRLPAPLETEARALAQRLGISLNSLICLSVGAYVRPPSLPLAPPATLPSPVLTSKPISHRPKGRRR